MMRSVVAELFVLRKRSAVWILLAIWTALAVFFAYALPYASYLNNARDMAPLPGDLLPGHLVGTLMGGFPFFGGAITLILGVLAVGSDYDWGMLKTLLTQRPGRMQIVGSMLVALGIILVLFVLAVFVAGAVSSVVIAWREGAAISWPDAWLVLRAFLAAWLMLAVWAAMGFMLAVLSRGTALAIGIGILYALVIEGLLSAFASQLSFLEPLVDFFLRANAYSLTLPLAVSSAAIADNGPGGFSGPFVSGTHALVVLIAYLLAFLAISVSVVRQRDVT